MENKIYLGNDSVVGGIQKVAEELNLDNLGINNNEVNKVEFGYNGNGAYTYLTTQHKFGYPTIFTVFKTDKVGIPVDAYGADLETIKYMDINNKGKDWELPIIKEYVEVNMAGRPIIITLTDKQYLLINLHNVNDPADSKIGMMKFRKYFNNVVNKAIEYFATNSCYVFDHKKILIMGDFNDPYSGINDNDPLKINVKINVKINGYKYTTGRKTALKSCCYNFNSSCKDDEFNSDFNILDKDEKIVTYQNECKPNTKGNTKGMEDKYPGRGNLENYRFSGDYCFGFDVIKKLEIYRPLNDVRSSESDHEFVYATFTIPITTPEPDFKQYMCNIKQLAPERFINWPVEIKKNDVLIIVDMQNDFVDYQDIKNSQSDQIIEGTFGGANTLQGPGTFGVTDSKNMIVADFVNVIEKFKKVGADIIATKDYHPVNHCSFNTDGGVYPPHCVWGKDGAKIVKPIIDELENYENSKIFYKGFHQGVDSYSAFEYKKYTNKISKICGCEEKIGQGGCNTTWTGSFLIEGVKIGDNPTDEQMKTFISDCTKDEEFYNINNSCKMIRLNTYLQGKIPVGNIYVVGLAGDICVLDTAINASKVGYEGVYIISDLIRNAYIPEVGYVNKPKDFAEKIEDASIKIIESKQIKNGGLSFGRKSRRSLRKNRKSKRKSRRKSKRSLRKNRKSKRKSRRKSKRSLRKNRKSRRSLRKNRKSKRKSKRKSRRKSKL